MSVELRSPSSGSYNHYMGGGYNNNTHAVRTPASINFDKIIVENHVKHVNSSVIYGAFTTAQSIYQRSGSEGPSSNSKVTPLSPMQKEFPYNAALNVRTPQRTAPLVPLNSQPHTYNAGFHQPKNNYVGKIGWGCERPDLALVPQRHVIGSSAGTGSAALLPSQQSAEFAKNNPTLMRGEWDRARNHEFLGDRGGFSSSPNGRIEEMAEENFDKEDDQ